MALAKESLPALAAAQMFGQGVCRQIFAGVQPQDCLSGVSAVPSLAQNQQRCSTNLQSLTNNFHFAHNKNESTCKRQQWQTRLLLAVPSHSPIFAADATANALASRSALTFCRGNFGLRHCDRWAAVILASGRVPPEPPWTKIHLMHLKLAAMPFRELLLQLRLKLFPIGL